MEPLGSIGDRRVVELMDRIGRMAHTMQYVGGLNPAQWEALRYIAQANRYSRVPGALADYLGTTKGTVSQTLRALESKGYIRRQPHGLDRRKSSLDLTPDGRALLDRDPMLGLEESISGLPTPLKEAMAEGLSLVLNGVRRQCQQREFGVCERCQHLDAGESACGNNPEFCCGLNGDPLSEDDRGRICANFKPSAG